MTEDEWNESTDPQAMLTFLQGKGCASDRKLRLFAVACCRRVEHLMADERSRQAVDVAEQFADGLLHEADLAAARHGARAARGKPGQRSAANAALYATRLRAADAAAWCSPGAPYLDHAGASEESVAACARSVRVERRTAVYAAERAAQAALVRCIFGVLPFRGVTVMPSWKSETVVGLAQRVYEERPFELMPVLGDALEEAGCADVDVLTHCRSAGPHARGCFVLDLILSKR